MKYLSFIFFFFLHISLFSQVSQNIKGEISDELGNKLIGSTVTLIPNNTVILSNQDGQFSFLDLSPGRYEIHISHVGKKTKQIKELLLDSSKELSLQIILEEGNTELSEISIVGNQSSSTRALTGIKSINMEQIFRFPATFFDPARLLTSFAGVAAQNDQANGLSIRGNNPDRTSWWLEDTEIVNPNHLANAGTFSDKATFGGGGVNMLSSQLLGEMSLLNAPFPANYGNATAGILNMRLRNGATDKNHNTLQVGLLGIDVATEGPFKKGGSASYLFNYRYSFTGILTGFGVDFGGEKIKFSDFSGKVNFPLSNGANLSYYLITGNHSNNFDLDFDKNIPISEKDFQIINYKGNTFINGLNYSQKIDENFIFKSAFAYSQRETSRYSEFKEHDNLPSVFTPGFAENSFFNESLFSTNNQILQSLKSGAKINYAINFALKNYYFTEEKERIIRTPVWRPSVSFESSKAKNTQIQIGLGASIYTRLYSETILEPRLALVQRVDKKNTVEFAIGKNSQYQNPIYSEYWSPNQDLQPIIQSWNTTLAWKNSINENSDFSVEGFYSISENNLVGDLNFSNFYSTVNSVDPLIFLTDQFDGQARNYGVEINYNKYLTNGFFVLANATLFKSEFEVDEKYYPTSFDLGKIINITLGKEKTLKNGNLFGFNAKLNWTGGLRSYNIEILNGVSGIIGDYIDYSNPLEQKNSDYIRPDIRIYLKKFKAGKSSLWSLDIQNIIGRQNDGFYYYDHFLNAVTPKKQLGLIPMLNYRVEF